MIFCMYENDKKKHNMSAVSKVSYIEHCLTSQILCHFSVHVDSFIYNDRVVFAYEYHTPLFKLSKTSFTETTRRCLKMYNAMKLCLCLIKCCYLIDRSKEWHKWGTEWGTYRKWRHEERKQFPEHQYGVSLLVSWQFRVMALLMFLIACYFVKESVRHCTVYKNNWQQGRG